MCYLPSLLSHLRPYHKFLQQCLLVQGMQAGGLPGPRAVHERVLLIRKQISGIERGLHSIAKKRVSWYNGWQAAQVLPIQLRLVQPAPSLTARLTVISNGTAKD